MILARQSANVSCARVRAACVRLFQTVQVPVHSQPAAFHNDRTTASVVVQCRTLRRASQWRSIRCYSASNTPEVDDLVELEIKVEGMMCEGCTSRVQEALQKAAPHSKVTVSLENKMASVEVQAQSQLDALSQLPKLVEVVKAAGFEAEAHIDGL